MQDNCRPPEPSHPNGYMLDTKWLLSCTGVARTVLAHLRGVFLSFLLYLAGCFRRCRIQEPCIVRISGPAACMSAPAGVFVFVCVCAFVCQCRPHAVDARRLQLQQAVASGCSTDSRSSFCHDAPRFWYGEDRSLHHLSSTARLGAPRIRFTLAYRTGTRKPG